MSKVNLMTQAEYAKHRGCSGVSVHKAVKAGRISLINGKIDPVVADLQWQANTRARISNAPTTSQISQAQRLTSGSEARTSVAAGTSAPDDTNDDYWKNRARREAAEASIAEMKQAEMAGNLVRIDAMKSAWASKVSAVRDALLQIPARVAPVLAAESDMDRIVEVLEDDLRKALQQLNAVSEVVHGS